MSGINLDVYKAKHIVPEQLQHLLPIRYRFLFKRFSAKLDGHLLKLLPFIMTRISTLQRLVPLSFKKLFDTAMTPFENLETYLLCFLVAIWHIFLFSLMCQLWL